MPGERLGQNFLVDAGWRSKIVQSLPLRWGDTWIEIGAGRGEITQLIAKQVKQVIAIELDANLAAGLRRNTAGSGKIEIIEGDVLTVPFAALFARIDTPIRIYGSLPYYITSPILHLLFGNAHRLESAHVIMQLEVAARVTSKPKSRDYGYLSVAAQAFSEPTLRLRIPPGAFRPQPKVASALVELKFPGPSAGLGLGGTPEDPYAKVFLEFVRGCFAQKRKTLANNLIDYMTHDQGPRKEYRDTPDQVRALLQIAGIAANARAEELTVEQFATLFKIAAAEPEAEEATEETKTAEARPRSPLALPE